MWSGSAQVLFRLFVSAIMKMPIGFQLRASWSPGEIFADRTPSRLAMLAHVVCGDLVRNALKAEAVNQPVEQRCAIVPVDCGTQILIRETLRSDQTSQRSSRLGESGERHNQSQTDRCRLSLPLIAPQPDLQCVWRPSEFRSTTRACAGLRYRHRCSAAWSGLIGGQPAAGRRATNHRPCGPTGRPE